MERARSSMRQQAEAHRQQLCASMTLGHMLSQVGVDWWWDMEKGKFQLAQLKAAS